MAIIIDDLGGEIEPAKKLAGFNTPIAFSVLPHLKRSHEVAEMAHTAGLVVMLHLPMESKWVSVNPGPGALLTNQSVADITKIVSDDIG
ncbi:MAG: divergent polysaccharide deacetylase family protein, partial [Nitrospinae bacterium]|nr:divergent polysaccharide deacetylase family protein [Nitrospinota bacterium]